MARTQAEQTLRKIDKQLQASPNFLRQYYQDRKLEQLAPRTLSAYLGDILEFLQWMQDNGAFAGKPRYFDIRDFTKLRKPQVLRYFDSLRDRTGKMKAAKYALINFADWLMLDAEIDDVKLNRNLFKLVKLPKDAVSIQQRGQELKDKLFLGDESQVFLDFIELEYEHTLESHQARGKFSINKDRDLALIALLLASGIRLHEIESADIANLDLDNNTLKIWRKGHKQAAKMDTVYIAPFAKPYLIKYLRTRQETYHTDKLTKDNVEALFLSKYSGKIERLSAIAIDRIVRKYSRAYGKAVSPHKLRHTMASRLYEETKDIMLVKQQLGHESLQATMVYTHVGVNALRAGLAKL